jgi:hypothetical protein
MRVEYARGGKMSDNEFRWLIVVALWALVVIQLGTGFGLDSLLKPIVGRLESIESLLQEIVSENEIDHE